MASWDAILEEQLVSGGHCYAGGLANASDCAFYAAAPVAEGEGWKHVWSEEHQQDIQVDVDKFEKKRINENEILQHALETGSVSGGLWLGQSKYKLVQYDPDFDVNGKR